MKKRSGFTLIELIVTIAILAILAVIIFVALDPAMRIHQSRNARRWSDVTAIIKAVKTYETDTGGLPTSIDTDADSVQVIGESLGNCTSVVCTGQTVANSNCAIDDFDTALRAYLNKPPTDPQNGTDNDTRYYINRDAYGIITVGACDVEGEDAGGTGDAPTIAVMQ
ncbi:MAG: type II secretion system protein [Candidatus Peregrinibacteria bacterium]